MKYAHGPGSVQQRIELEEKEAAAKIKKRLSILKAKQEKE